MGGKSIAGGVAAAMAVGIVGVGVAPSAEAAVYAQCRVTKAKVIATNFTEDKTYYRYIEEWDVSLTGNKVVLYRVKCGKVRAHFKKRERAFGMTMYETDSYEAAYDEAYREAVETDYSRHELVYGTFKGSRKSVIRKCKRYLSCKLRGAY